MRSRSMIGRFQIILCVSEAPPPSSRMLPSVIGARRVPGVNLRKI